MALDPQDLHDLMEAFLSTDVGQFIQQKMTKEAGTNAIAPASQEAPEVEAEPEGAMPPDAEVDEIPTPEATEPPAHAPDEPPPPALNVEEPKAEEAAPPAAPAAAPEAAPAPNKLADDDAEKYGAACKSMDTISDDHLEKYLHNNRKNAPKWKKYSSEESNGGTPGGGASGGGGEKEGAPQSENYSKLHGEVSRLQKELTEERGKRIQTERYSRLGELSGSYILDMEAELADAADMTSDQFNRHCQRISEHYQRNPTGLPWAVPDMIGDTAEPTATTRQSLDEATTEKQAIKATELYEKARNDGKNVEFGEVLAAVKAGRPI